jgi:hypothetical protein
MQFNWWKGAIGDGKPFAHQAIIAEPGFRDRVNGQLWNETPYTPEITVAQAEPD